MPYRGTLKQCINCAVLNFTNNDFRLLYILHCPHGKYYTCATEEQATDLLISPASPEHRIVFHGTLAELKAFHGHDQLHLFDLGVSDASTKAQPLGEQQHRDPAPQPPPSDEPQAG